MGAAATPPIPMDVVIAHELEIYGSHGMAAHEYPPMLTLIANRTLRPDRLLGDIIGLDDAGAALAAMDRSATSAGMTVIDLSRCVRAQCRSTGLCSRPMRSRHGDGRRVAHRRERGLWGGERRRST
jgi:hypothetical protein